MGFAVLAVPAWLAEAGVPTAKIGMIGATTMLPWAFKVAWAPLVDRFKYRAMGRFRAWILGAQLGLVASTLTLLWLPSPSAHLHALAAALFAMALFAAMSDVAGDGLAIEVLPPSERGLANGVMTGCQAAGNVLGSAGVSAVLAVAGFRAAAGTLVLLLAVACVPTVLLRERPGERLLPWTRGAPLLVPADRAPVALAGGARLVARSIFTRRSARPLVVWIAAYVLSGSMGILMAAAAVRDHGFRQAEYASLGAMALGPNLVGALVGGRLADKKGRATVVAVTLMLGAVTWAVFGLLAPEWSIKGVWVVQALATGAVSGALTTALTAQIMDLTDPRVAATQFAICMGLGNLGSVAGRASAGMLEARFSLAGFALVASAGLAVLALWTARATALSPLPRRAPETA